MHPPPIVFFVVTPCPLREINPPRHVIKTQYKMFKRRTKNMKKTLLVLISIIAAIALVGCNAETQGPSTEEPSTPALTGAEVATRALSMMNKYGAPSTTTAGAIEVTDPETVAEEDVTESNGLVVGDIISSSTASLSYDGFYNQLTASTNIAVTLSGTNYTLKGEVVFGLTTNSVSSVISSTLVINDDTGVAMDITDDNLITAISPFSDDISSIIDAWDPVAVKFVAPSWINPNIAYEGQGNDTVPFMNGAKLAISESDFSISFNLTEGMPINISSATEGVVVTKCESTDSDWSLALYGVPVSLFGSHNVIVDITTDGENLNVDVNVVTLNMPIPDIKFVPQG